MPAYGFVSVLGLVPKNASFPAMAKGKGTGVNYLISAVPSPCGGRMAPWHPTLRGFHSPSAKATVGDVRHGRAHRRSDAVTKPLLCLIHIFFWFQLYQFCGLDIICGGVLCVCVRGLVHSDGEHGSKVSEVAAAGGPFSSLENGDNTGTCSACFLSKM